MATDMATDTLYEADFVIWTERQADALRQAARTGSNLPVDWDNLAEEIESVGRGERRTVDSLVHQIVSHLLKFRYSPMLQVRYKWEGEIETARDMLRRTLADSPSLRPRLAEIVAGQIPAAWRAAIRSLERYDELEGAEEIRASDVALTAEQVQDEGYFLPGTTFATRDAVRERER